MSVEITGSSCEESREERRVVGTGPLQWRRNVLSMRMGTPIFRRWFGEFGKHDDKKVALEM
jgi:hypothetical protein